MATVVTAPPLRWQALELVADALRMISPGRGYHSHVKRVYRHYVTFKQVNEFPCLVVVEGDGSTLRPDTQLGYEHRFVVTIWGYVRAENGIPRSYALEGLDEDVARALLLPERAAWQQPIVSIQQINERETDGGLWEPLGGFAQDYEIILQEYFGNQEG